MILPYIVVCFSVFSCSWEARFIIIDVKISGIVDDVRGYGYKRKTRAYGAF
ncbi:hypothetical protein IGI96_003938, partial [Enterococcus sp. DIV0421]